MIYVLVGVLLINEKEETYALSCSDESLLMHFRPLLFLDDVAFFEEGFVSRAVAFEEAATVF